MSGMKKINMYIKRICYCLLIFIISMSISGCSSDVPSEADIRESEILSRVDNTASVDDLITVTYPEENLVNDLLNFSNSHTYGISMVNANMEYKIECIRKVGKDKYYTIHKSDNGGILYMYFTKSRDGYLRNIKDTNKYMVCRWYVSKEVKSM